MPSSVEAEALEIEPIDPSKPLEAVRGSVAPRAEFLARSSTRGLAARPDRNAPHHPAPEVDRSASAPGPDDYDAPDAPAIAPLEAPVGLSLSAEMDVAPPTLPAPTTTPAPIPVTGEDTARAIEASIRVKDANVGLGNPEENAVAVAVQTAGRATPVESGTRARFAIDIDANGSVTGVALLRASHGGADTWGDAIASIRATLSKKPVNLGPNAKRKGVRVIVDATVLHAYASGSDKYITVGPCPEMKLIGGETALHFNGPSADAPPFFNMGGAAYGRPPTGICPLGDIQSKHKQIVVHTRTSVVFPAEKQAPPPLDSFEPVPKPKPFSIWTLILGKKAP